MNVTVKALTDRQLEIALAQVQALVSLSD